MWRYWFSYNYSKSNSFLSISGTAYEDLSKKDNKKYEYILPDILFGKSFFTEKFGTLSLKSNALYKNYDVNKHLNLVTNDISWSSRSKITKGGFVNSLEGMINNTNYNATNTTDYKTSNKECSYFFSSFYMKSCNNKLPLDIFYISINYRVVYKKEK